MTPTRAQILRTLAEADGWTEHDNPEIPELLYGAGADAIYDLLNPRPQLQLIHRSN